MSGDPLVRLMQRLPGDIMPMILKLSAECARWNIDLCTVRTERHGERPKLVEVVTLYAPGGKVEVEVGL